MGETPVPTPGTAPPQRMDTAYGGEQERVRTRTRGLPGGAYLRYNGPVSSREFCFF